MADCGHPNRDGGACKRMGLLKYKGRCAFHDESSPDNRPVQRAKGEPKKYGLWTRWSPECRGTSSRPGAPRNKLGHDACRMVECICRCHIKHWGHLRVVERRGKSSVMRVSCRSCGDELQSEFPAHGQRISAGLADLGWLNMAYVPETSFMGRLPQQKRGPWLCPDCLEKWGAGEPTGDERHVENS